jgi:hypothetical protein
MTISRLKVKRHDRIGPAEAEAEASVGTCSRASGHCLLSQHILTRQKLGVLNLSGASSRPRSKSNGLPLLSSNNFPLPGPPRTRNGNSSNIHQIDKPVIHVQTRQTHETYAE